MARQAGDDADGSRVCPLLERRLPSTTQRDFGFPLRRMTLVMSESNTCALVGTSAHGVGMKVARLSSKVSGRSSRSFDVVSSHASQSPRRSTVWRDMAPGSDTSAGMFVSWSLSLLASNSDVGVEAEAVIVTAAVGVRHIDAGTSGTNRSAGCLARVGRGVKPGGGGGVGEFVMSARCGSSFGH